MGTQLHKQFITLSEWNSITYRC